MEESVGCYLVEILPWDPFLMTVIILELDMYIPIVVALHMWTYLMIC